MIGRLKDLTFGRSGEQILSIETRSDCRTLWDNLSQTDVTISIKKYSTRRSLRANAYAWTLMEKIAAVISSDKDSVYEQMLRRYGTGDSYTDEQGNECKIIFSLRVGIPPNRVATHFAEIGRGFTNGQEFIHYRAIKGSSEYDTKEMSVFLDGIISECKELGIETATPEQIARYKEDWGKSG